MGKLPKDCTARVIGSEARKLVHYKFSSERWEYREVTGVDNGTDCVVELIENERWTNKKIEGQIKGTRNPKKLKAKNAYSISVKIKTINYGLSCTNPFVLFYVLVDEELVLYLPIQDYFISNFELFDKLKGDQEEITVHVPADNIVSEEDFDLQEIAKSVYVGGPHKDLHKIK